MEEASLLETISTVCLTVYQTAMRAQSNRERCQSLAQRVKSLEAVVLGIKEQGQCHITSMVVNCLNDLLDALTAAEYLMRKYSKNNTFMGLLKSSSQEDKFRKIDEKIRINLELLCGAMQFELGDTNQIYITIGEGTEASGTVPEESSAARSTSSALTPARTVATPLTRPPAAIPLPPPPASIPLTRPPASIPLTRPPAAIKPPPPPASIPLTRPPAAIKPPPPPASIPLARPPAAIPLARPPAAIPLTRPPAAIPLTHPPAAIPLTHPPAAIPLTHSPAAIPFYGPVPHFMPMATAPMVNPMMTMVSPGAVTYVSSSNPLLSQASSAAIYGPSAQNYFGPTISPLHYASTGVTQSWTMPLSPQNTVVTTPINYMFR